MNYGYVTDLQYELNPFDQVSVGAMGESPFVSVDMAEFGVDPRQPTKARPGSDEKVLTLAARYAAGLPLWHEEDCADHGDATGTEVDSYSDGTYGYPEFDEMFNEEECELVGDVD